MSPVNLDGRRFSPISNSAGGRVTSDAVFEFKQTGPNFSARYSGEGFTDGHLIGTMTTPGHARLVYHCRAPNGDLEVGQAEAAFETGLDGRMRIKMLWRWLNGSLETGTSHYGEIDDAA